MNVAACHCERNAAISFWCIIAIGLALTGVSVASAKYSGGTGEPNDPYQIATAVDLIALGEEPNDYDKHFILTAAIDLDPQSAWLRRLRSGRTSLVLCAAVVRS